MAIKTDDVKVGGGNLPKSFGPGNHTAKINSIELRVPGYVKKTDPIQYELVLDLETSPLGGTFEGWQLDKEDPSKGNFLGQTGRIKTRKWAYKDGTWKNPKTGKTVEFSYLDDILEFIQRIEDACGTKFLKETSGKFNTIEEIVAAFNKTKPFKGIFLRWCIGGEVEMKDDGHPQYFMFLPDPLKGFKLFTSEADKDSLAPYNADRDLSSKDAPKTVGTFTADAQGKEDEDGDTPPWAEATNDDDPFSTSDDDDEDPFGEV